MARSRQTPEHSTTRNGGKHNSKGATGLPVEKIGEATDKLPPNQKQAIEGLLLGSREAGREFKERGSEPDSPIVEQRPPMPNESARTDQDRRGGRKAN